MHVVCVNYTYDVSLTSPAAVFARYKTLVGWAEAVTAAGARFSVVHSFGEDIEITRNGVLYRFRRGRSSRLNHATIDLRPDIIHVNGLQFAAKAALLKRSLPSMPVLLQDHANLPPRHWLRRWRLRKVMRLLDAF